MKGQNEPQTDGSKACLQVTPGNNSAAGEPVTKSMPTGKRFQPGQSGNPNGRPKRTQAELDLVAACKKKAPAALRVLVTLMEGGENDTIRLKAAIAIIERAYGKPSQPITAEDEIVIIRNYRTITSEEL